MDTDTVVVLTSKSINTMIKEGGSGNWNANENRIRRCRWLVAVRNRHSSWSEGTEDHSAAFLIAKITGVKPSPTEAGRLVITFDQYAVIERANAWPGNRNPIAYIQLSTLGIDPGKLKWVDFPPQHQGTATTEAAGAVSPAAVFEQAKMMIAAALSVQPDAIQIKIRL